VFLPVSGMPAGMAGEAVSGSAGEETQDLLDQALQYIAQHRTGVIIMVAVMFLTLWLRNRR
jgi:hypothetical protein